jgi:hypothetical protein
MRAGARFLLEGPRGRGRRFVLAFSRTCVSRHKGSANLRPSRRSGYVRDGARRETTNGTPPQTQEEAAPAAPSPGVIGLPLDAIAPGFPRDVVRTVVAPFR